MNKAIAAIAAAGLVAAGIGIGLVADPSDVPAASAALVPTAQVGAIAVDPAINRATLLGLPNDQRAAYLDGFNDGQLRDLWRLGDRPHTGGDTSWISAVALEMNKRGIRGHTETEPMTPAAAVPVVQPAAPVAQPGPATSFGSGTHIVGDELAPGLYRTDGAGFCYWERLRGLDGEFASIIANGHANGPSTVQVKATDKAIKVAGSCTWTKR